MDSEPILKIEITGFLIECMQGVQKRRKSRLTSLVLTRITGSLVVSFAVLKTMMVNFMHQSDWAIGYLDILTNNYSESDCEDVSEGDQHWN